MCARVGNGRFRVSRIWGSLERWISHLFISQPLVTTTKKKAEMKRLSIECSCDSNANASKCAKSAIDKHFSCHTHYASTLVVSRAKDFLHIVSESQWKLLRWRAGDCKNSFDEKSFTSKSRQGNEKKSLSRDASVDDFPLHSTWRKSHGDFMEKYSYAN